MKMKRHHMIAIAFTVALTGLLLAPTTHADEWKQTTRVTINEPIEVPGRVLTPGTYTFKLFDPGRHMVQIWNADQTHLYANIMTVPDYRPRPTGHTVLQLKETSKGAPPELRAWFYPGDTMGHEFVYSKSHAAAEKARA
jgi:hypothetical protein